METEVVMTDQTGDCKAFYYSVHHGLIEGWPIYRAMGAAALSVDAWPETPIFIHHDCDFENDRLWSAAVESNKGGRLNLQPFRDGGPILLFAEGFEYSSDQGGGGYTPEWVWQAPTGGGVFCFEKHDQYLRLLCEGTTHTIVRGSDDRLIFAQSRAA